MREADHASIVPRLLDIQQVASYTGLSVHTLYTMVSQRRIPFVKLGRLMQTRLREWREKRGLSLRKLGRLSGVHYVSLVKLEAGRLDPTLNSLKAVPRAASQSLSISRRDENEGTGITWA